MKPEPAETKPKPWFENQTKPEHHYCGLNNDGKCQSKIRFI
jgi:hypothetical protein